MDKFGIEDVLDSALRDDENRRLKRYVAQQKREIARLEGELAEAQQTARKHFQNAQNLMRYEVGKVELKSVEGKTLQ